MHTYEIYFAVNGQYSTARIVAASAGAAGNILRAQFHGCEVRISWINEVR